MNNNIDNYVEVVDSYLGPLVFPDYDDVIAPQIRDNGIWSPSDFDWVTENVTTGDVCINIGANAGYFTCLMSRLVGQAGEVYAIEAYPALEPFLRENVSRTGVDNVKVIMSAAGDKPGTLELYANSNNVGDNRAYNPELITPTSKDFFTGLREVTTVPVDTVDNLVEAQKVTVVMSDCQGWDHLVLRGMSDIIRRDAPKILVEFVPRWVESLGDSPIDVLNEYQSWGYEMLCPELGLLEPVSGEALLKALSDSGEWFTNIYLRSTSSKRTI